MLATASITNIRKLTINTQTINIVRLNELLDPAVEGRSNLGILGLDVRKRDNRIAKPAVLLARGVTPVDRTIRVVLRLG